MISYSFLFYPLVSRSLAACEGALLVVDASQGVEAQTMANVYLALENNLEIITCVNKIDLPNADAEKVMLEVESTIGLDTSNSIKCSAKTGTTPLLNHPWGNFKLLLRHVICPNAMILSLQLIVIFIHGDIFRGPLHLSCHFSSDFLFVAPFAKRLLLSFSLNRSRN